MMQIINTLLGWSASSRHVGSAHSVEGAVGSRRTEEAQPESGSTCLWGRPDSGCAPFTRCMDRFGLEGMGIGNAPDLSCWVSLPLMVWLCCHGSVVLVVKHAQFSYSVAPKCKPLGRDLTCPRAGAKGVVGSFSDTHLCWYISRVILLMPN